MFKPLTFISLLVVTLGTAYAHVKVSPEKAGIATYQEFTVSVPNEKDVPTIELRLSIPEGLEYVTPNVKPGWVITMKKSENKVTEITWSKGQIPPDMRDTFTFSAKTPANPSQLVWKTYQTYADKTVVAWDEEDEKGETEDKGPYSVTSVVDDTKASSNSSGLSLAAASLALSAAAIAIANRKRR